MTTTVQECDRARWRAEPALGPGVPGVPGVEIGGV